MKQMHFKPNPFYLFMKNIIVLALMFVAGLNATAQNIEEFYKEVDSFLGKHVKNGKVDYASIKKDPSQLNNLIEQTSSIVISKSNAAEYQAFWVNSYNLHVIDGLVKNYPIKSPLDSKGFFDTQKRAVSGEKLTLNDIENNKLRAQFHDARFHFVLVCGAQGCPPLISTSYKPATLEMQLDTQTKKSINNPAFVVVNGDKLAVSQIFEWYKVDFNTKGSTTVSFINSYLKKPVGEKAKLSYYNYNWSINKQ